MTERPSALRPVTAEEFEAGGERFARCELWDGVPVVREPAGGEHGVTVATVVGRLTAHLGGNPAGWALTGEPGFVVARGPDRVLAPDVAYVSRARMPQPVRGFATGAPDFAVEVRSPRDRAGAAAEKAGIWLAHGVRVVWVVDPMARAVTVHRPGVAPRRVAGTDVVDAAPVLPEFRVRVADLFPERSARTT